MSRPGWRLVSSFAVLSAIAVASGVVTMVLADIPTSRWIPNVAAWLVGALAAVVVVRAKPGHRSWLSIAFIGALLLAATLTGPDQMGVRRWIAIGPLSGNIAALVLPAVIVALARLGATHRATPIIATLLVATLVLQPDASQAIALALASLAVLLPARSPLGWSAVASIGGMAGLSLVQPDPLMPVPEVEQIIQMAGSVHIALAAVAVATLAALPLVVWRMCPADTAARALAAYTGAVIAAPVFGWFPVPLVGAGMSFPLGLWLGVALLATANADVRAAV